MGISPIGLSPTGESPGGVLAKVQWTFAIDESPIGESLIGEIPISLAEMSSLSLQRSVTN